MKILLVSDIESKYIWDHFDPERFRDVKMIISCGDLSPKYLSFLVTMIPAPLFYVPGNHDKRYEKEPPEGCINIDGRVVIYKGIRIMGLGGCKSTRGKTYEYTDEQMWKKVRRLEPQLKKVKGVDLFVTHAPAIGLGDGRDQFHEGFQSFRYIDDIYKPAIHCYGHVHIGENPMDRRAIYSYNDTVMVNACGYRLIDFEPGKPLDRPLNTQPIVEMPTPCPPKRMIFALFK